MCPNWYHCRETEPRTELPKGNLEAQLSVPSPVGTSRTGNDGKRTGKGEADTLNLPGIKLPVSTRKAYVFTTIGLSVNDLGQRKSNGYLKRA